MRSINIDAKLTEDLTALTEIAELRDTQGKLVGYFTPPTMFHAPGKPAKNPEQVKAELEALLRGLH